MPKSKISSTVEILFFSFPLSFIIGNLILSLHLLLFIIFSLILIKRENLIYRFKSSYWLLISFFLYFFLSTTIQFSSPGLLSEGIQGWSLESHPIFKSFLLLRFVILIFVVDTLFFNKILNFKKLFLVSFICTSFVSFDVIFQHFVGFDLFGYKSSGSRNSGPFGDEIIAGSYLQKFSFFSFFYIYEIFRNKNFNKPLLIFIIALHGAAIFVAGNRMPMLLFLFGCFLIIVFVKYMRLATAAGLVITLITSSFVVSNNSDLRKRYVDVVLYNFNMLKLPALDDDKPLEQKVKAKDEEKMYDEMPKTMNFLRTSGHGRIYRTSITMWKEQPWFGFGLKSFRIKCWDILKKWEGPNKNVGEYACSNHSHNYYLELLSEAGIVGIVLIISFSFILLRNSIIFLIKNKNLRDPEKYFLIPVILVFVLEVWPLRSTGSLFTTWTGTLFWLNAAMLYAANKKRSL